MIRMHLWILLMPFIAASCGLLGSGNDSPDIPGKIVFSAKDDAGTYQIYTMKADGSALKQLTDFGPEGSAVQPSWSPDGRQILFSSFKQGTSIGPALWVMDANGNNQQVLYDAEPDNLHAPPLAGNNARWSPDGTKVVFDLCLNCQIATNYEIYMFDTSTKALTKLTNHLASDTQPTWSPDGSRIAFVSNRDYSEISGTDLYIFNANENEVTRLTQVNAGRPVWHHDGKELIYWSENNLYQLNLMNSTSTKIHFEIEDGIGFRPLSISQAPKKILLHVFSYANPHNNQSLQILDINDKRLVHIYTNAAFSGADWFVSTK